MKKPESIELRINSEPTLCEYVEDNFYACDIPVIVNIDGGDGCYMHVEVFPVVEKKLRKGEWALPTLKNESFQGRLDDWLTRNDDCLPKLVDIPGLGKCFVHVEVFAQ